MAIQYLIFKNRVEIKSSIPVDKFVSEAYMRLMEGDPIEIARFVEHDEALKYIRSHPGCYWKECTFSSCVIIVECCWIVKCSVDEYGEIVDWHDEEFAELKAR